MAARVREDGTVEMAEGDPAAVHNPHPHHRRETAATHVVDNVIEFQSTPPTRGATL